MRPLFGSLHLVWFSPIIALGLVLLLTPVRDALWATFYLADFLAGDGPSVFKKLTAKPIVEAGTLELADQAEVPFALYQIPGIEKAPAVIFTHGFAHRGYRDQRVAEQAQRLARAGYIVLTPDLEQMKSYRLGFRDAEAVAACVQYALSLKQVDSTRVGAVAPSFGAGPVLIALSRPEVRQRVNFALIFGGYFDLHRTLRYTLTGAYKAAGYEGRVDPSVNRRNRWKFLRGNVDLLPPSPSQSTFHNYLDAKIAAPKLSLELPSLAPAERHMIEFIANEDPARFDSLYAQVPPTVKTWIDTLSLQHYTANIKAQVLLVHSTADTKVSFTESLALSRHLNQTPPPQLFILSLFDHVDLRLSWDSLNAVWEEVLPGLGQLWSLGYRLMRLRR